MKVGAMESLLERKGGSDGAPAEVATMDRDEKL